MSEQSPKDQDNKLPEGWMLTTLGDICLKPQYGWTTKATEEGNLHLLRTTDITSGSVKWETVPFCTEEPSDSKKYLLVDGDIVISRAGSVGYSLLVKNPRKSVFASYLIRFKSLIDESYVAYFLKSPDYWQVISEEKLGIAIPNVNATKLRKIIFPLAPFPEQKRIVAKIEELFTQLDAGVAALERAQANLKRYKASVLKAACEGRLVPTEAELNPDDYEPASVLLERILKERREKWEADLIAEGKEPSKRKYKEPAQPDVENLPELPEGWVWTRFDSLLVDGLSNGLYKSAKYISDDGIRIIDIKGLYKGFFADFDNCRRFDLTNDEINRYSLQEGDILINRVSKVHEGVGKPALVETLSELTVYESNMMRAEVSSFLNTRYLIYILHSSFVRNQLINKSKRTQQSSVNQVDVKSIIVPIPPKEEQERIVRRTEKLYSLIQRQEKQVVISIKRADRLRQSILKKAFEGKLVPQDPNDEPASVLLKRIKRKKASEE